MFCKKCGKELKENARFCSGCGAVIGSEPDTAEEVTIAPVESVEMPTSKKQVQEKPVREKVAVKKNKIVFFIVLICILILGGIVLAWFWGKDKETENTESMVSGNEKENETENVTSDNVQQNDSEEKSLVDVKMSQKRSEVAFAGDRGNVVSDGKNTYIYAEGFIYQLDREGKATPLCAVEKLHYAYDYGYYPTSIGLQLYDGVLYYVDNERIMAYDPTKGYAECLIEEDYIYGFYVNGKYIYFRGDRDVINKYGIDEKAIVQKLESPEDWNGTSYIAGRSPHAEDEIIIGNSGSIYDTDPDTGETTNYRYLFTFGYSNLQNVSGTQSFELDWSTFNNSDITTQNYIYLYHVVINTKGYEEERIYKVPSVIVEDDWLNMLEILDGTDSKNANIIKEYYKKYDINNWREKDEEIRDEMLERFPVLEEEVIYVLRDNANSKVKIKFEKILDDAGISDDLMKKAAELDKNPPDESQNKELFRLICINPETLQAEYSIEQSLYIRSVLGYYENDLIVYAYINDVAGVYRIPERNLWECGLNGQPLQPELIFAVETDSNNMGKYTFDVHPTDEYLYYTMHYDFDNLNNLSKLCRIKWDKGILSEGTVEEEKVIELYSNGGLEESDSRYSSVWVDGVEFRILGYPDQESQLVKAAVDEHVVQMVLPRSMDFTQYRLTAWNSEVQDGQKTISYYFMRSDSEALCISFISGTGVQKAFDASYDSVKGEEGVVDLQTINGKGYTVQSNMAIPETEYSISMPIKCCTATIYAPSLQVICSVTLLNDEDMVRRQFEGMASEIAFEEITDTNMLYRTSIVGEEYDKRMDNMYAKYKEIQKDTDKYMTEICENPGSEFDFHHIFDLTQDGVPEIIFMGSPRWICIVGEKNALNLGGNGVVFGSEPGTFYTPMFWTGSGAWVKYKVTADEQGYLVLEVLEEEYLAANQDVFTYRGNVIDEQTFYDKEKALDSCYIPNAILYYWGQSASESQFYNSVKRLAPTIVE